MVLVSHTGPLGVLPSLRNTRKWLQFLLVPWELEQEEFEPFTKFGRATFLVDLRDVCYRLGAVWILVLEKPLQNALQSQDVVRRGIPMYWKTPKVFQAWWMHREEHQGLTGPASSAAQNTTGCRQPRISGVT